MIQQLKNKKILITGGTGFIGKELVKELIENEVKCYVITRQNFEDTKYIKYIQYDLNNFEEYPTKLLNITFDYCIYLAANIPTIGQKKENYIEAKTSTLDPLLKFLTKFNSNIKKFIYISSIDVLGRVMKENYDEKEEINVPTPYGLAKYCGEFYVKTICQSMNIPWCILRFSQVYGKREPLVRIIPIIVNSLKEKKEFTLYTTGEEKRRFLYIKDAVKSIICACIKGKNKIYNIAGTNNSSINNLINIIENKYEEKLNILRKNEVIGYDNIPSISNAENELGYMPEYTLEKGISEIIKEIKDENK